MKKLYEKLKHYDLEKILELEKSDRQFIALQQLEKNIKDKELYLALVIANSIICYQLSWKWEDYWEEFSDYFSDDSIKYNDIVFELSKFISQSKNNKRFIDTKIKRLKKLESFLYEFYDKSKFFYDDMTKLRNFLAKTMWQKKDAKTIVFAVKMFGYAARNIYDFLPYPNEISIPIDSRLISLYESYNEDEKLNIDNFYENLSSDLSISPLHLDAIVWINFEELINNS